ncbi:type III pantothenate kinase [Rubrivirga sp. IMCC45206]|uniref:type III pantothenate kinase n=1 Tax=Rubrivirga sp. IMCC45206 TaxID=3391614 RepID=UPI00398FD844
MLVLDIGNSSVKAAVWQNGWGPVSRFACDGASGEIWRERLASLGPANRGALASVVPHLTPVLAAALEEVTGARPFVVTAEAALPFRLAVATPDTLGADRLAAAVAAHALAGGRAVIAVDAGSAVTVEAVSAEPAYLGGAIAPGPDLLRRSLARDTGQLPDVPWPATLAPVGDSTRGAIQAGLGVLFADGVAGLVERTRDALGGDALVVATGGWAEWLAAHTPVVDRVVPTLVLDGVRQLAAGQVSE